MSEPTLPDRDAVEKALDQLMELIYGENAS
jgi:hypothetical protein